MYNNSKYAHVLKIVVWNYDFLSEVTYKKTSRFCQNYCMSTHKTLLLLIA